MTKSENDHSCPAPPPGLLIRPATFDDAQVLSRMIRELAAFESLEHECAITVDSVREHLLGLNRSAEAVVAEVDGVVAGFAVYYRTFSTFAARPGVFIEDLFVRPSLRRRGLGRALLQHVASIAARSNSGRLEWTTLKWNESARRLYRAIGAEEKSEWLLLRMDTPAMSEFSCRGAGKPTDSSRCGGKGAHHRNSEPFPGQGPCGCSDESS